MAALLRAPAFKPGERVRVIGKEAMHEGTCRFFGTTLFREGNWVGVELDLPNGKNDGSVAGTRYFSCPPRYGLFARAEVVELLPRTVHTPYGSLAGRGQSTTNTNEGGRERGRTDRDLVFGQTLKVDASVFSFNKAKNEWSEVSEGQVSLFVGRQGNESPRVRLKSVAGPGVDHYIELETKLEPNVGSDRAWVFRAKTISGDKGEVLALQFLSPKDAMMFSSQYAICSQIVRDKSWSPTEMQVAPRSPMPRAPSAGAGAPPPPPPPPPTAQQDPTNAIKRAVSKDRRRLSIAGADATVDGRRGSSAVKDRNDSGDTPLQTSSVSLDGAAGTIVRSYVGMSKKGYAPYNIKKENQDSCFMHEDPQTRSLLLGVFDGHGEHGHLVSKHLEKRLPSSVMNHPSWATSPKTAMAEMLVAEEGKILKNRSINTSLSGTTAVCATVRGKALTVANIGDSRLILALRNESGNLKPYSVTEDHKPDTPKEKQRIERNGGRVWAMTYEDGIDGPARVWLKDQDLPGLAMSRSIGDEVAKRAGVISAPEMFEYELPEETAFLCMATDGLWEFMSNNDVVHIIEQANGDGRKAIQALMKESERRWKKEEPVVDDTTIVLAYFSF